MSNKIAAKWLVENNRFSHSSDLVKIAPKFKKAATVSITGGKGGVGKTSIALKMGKSLTAMGHKVLLIDFDYNLANTSIKLGLGPNNNFEDLLLGKINFEQSIQRLGDFHILSGSNGNLEVFDYKKNMACFIIELIANQEDNYDYILIDCPAGIQNDSLMINTYSDYRFFIVTPDRSSITDSYALIKILQLRFGVRKNHLLVNKISNDREYKKIIKSIVDTTANFLDTSVKALGGIKQVTCSFDRFDQVFLSEEESSFNQNFNQIIKSFSDEVLSQRVGPELGQVAYSSSGMDMKKHEVSHLKAKEC